MESDAEKFRWRREGRVAAANALRNGLRRWARWRSRRGSLLAKHDGARRFAGQRFSLAGGRLN